LVEVGGGDAGGVALLSRSRVVLQRFPEGTEDKFARALERELAIEHLVRMENPGSRLQVKLWAGKPGDVRFSTKEPVPFRIQVAGPASLKSVYLTLLGIGPDGTLSILVPYVQGGKLPEGVVAPVNLEMRLGKIYTLPFTPEELPGAVGVVTPEVWLGQGREFFKAIVTSEPLDTNSLNLGSLAEAFRGGGGVRAIKAIRDLQEISGQLDNKKLEWATTTLVLEGY
jgi:hypothetical protein